MKKLKKTAAFLLAAAMLIITGCNGVNIVDASYIAKVNGEEIKTVEFMYYLAVAKMTIQQSADTSVNADFWNTTEIDGKKAIEVAKEKALEDAVKATIIAQKAMDEGFSADTSEATQQINNAVSGVGEYAEANGFTEEGIKMAYKKAYLRTKLFDKYEEDGKISVSADEMKEYYEKNFRTVKHILIMTTDPDSGAAKRTDEEALALAEEIEKSLADGADFDSLMAEKSEDPGSASNPEGYTFAKNGSMVKEFEETAFKLQENEISAPVKTSYGYHILKRCPLISYDKYIETNGEDSIKTTISSEAEDKFVDEWKKDAKIETNGKKYDSIKIKE